MEATAFGPLECVRAIADCRVYLNMQNNSGETAGNVRCCLRDLEILSSFEERLFDHEVVVSCHSILYITYLRAKLLGA